MATPTRPTSSSSSSSIPSLPPPYPKSPPEYPDLYGKRRQAAKTQMLEREIGFLEEELKSTEGLQPASKCCKEVADYVIANSDPLIPTYKKHRRRCQFWKWLCGFPCCKLSWICCCCYAGCSIHLEIPPCCNCNNPCKCLSCGSCKLPKWQCCGECRECCGQCGQCCCTCPTLPQCTCPCPTISCTQCCSHFSLPSCSCLDCPCCECKCKCKCTLGKCPNIRPCCCFGSKSCCGCTGNCCCNPFQLCC